MYLHFIIPALKEGNAVIWSKMEQSSIYAKSIGALSSMLSEISPSGKKTMPALLHMGSKRDSLKSKA